MKKVFDWKLMLSIILVVMSATVYLIHYAIFRDAHHIFIYLIGDIAFVFLEVLLVTIILHKLLVYREKQAMLKKLNMVIGTFFNEVGTELLKRCSEFDVDSSRVTKLLVVTGEWSYKKFQEIKKELNRFSLEIDYYKSDIGAMKAFLLSKRKFLLDLMGNPNLLEHDAFTDLLWAVFHLTDELEHRDDLTNLIETDSKHIAGDVRRAYCRLIFGWFDYMRHLMKDYPYLFSLAMRTNPFDPDASIEVK